VKHAWVYPKQAGAEDLPGAPQVNGRAPQRFMPFSLGARDCVGQTLARLNLATTLAQLYGSFTFRLAAEVCTYSHASLTPCTQY
jgi:cytochrome P450